MYETEKKEYLNRLKKTARSSWIFGVFLVILMLSLLHFTSQNKQVIPKIFSNNLQHNSNNLDNRVLVKQSRFKERVKTVEKVCDEENKRKRYKYDLIDHISQ